jgi:hypothetical protein
VADILELERAVLRGQFPNWQGDSLETLVTHAVRKEIRERLKLLSFEEFARQQMEHKQAASESSAQLAQETDLITPADKDITAEPSLQPVSGTDVGTSLENDNSSQGSGGTEIENKEELSSPQHQEAAAPEPATDPVPPQTDSGTTV